MKRIALLSLVATLCLVLCVACGQRKNAIMGDWVVADSTPTVGFTLGANGLAASIGHPDIQYLRWSLNDKTLLLNGKHYCEGCAADHTDTLIVAALEPEQTLTVLQDGEKTRYVRP